MEKQRIVILILSIVGILSTFSPWLNIPIWGGVNGLSEPMKGIGWFSLLCFAFTLIISFVGELNRPLNNRVFFILPSFASVGIAFYVVLSIRIKMTEMAENDFFGISSVFSVGYGLYLTILCSISMLILGIVLGNKDSMKKEIVQSESKNNLTDNHQDKISQLQQLKQLLDDGVLTEQEFEEQKSKILKK